MFLGAQKKNIFMLHLHCQPFSHALIAADSATSSMVLLRAKQKASSHLFVRLGKPMLNDTAWNLPNAPLVGSFQKGKTNQHEFHPLFGQGCKSTNWSHQNTKVHGAGIAHRKHAMNILWTTYICPTTTRPHLATLASADNRVLLERPSVQCRRCAKSKTARVCCHWEASWDDRYRYG